MCNSAYCWHGCKLTRNNPQSRPRKARGLDVILFLIIIYRCHYGVLLRTLYYNSSSRAAFRFFSFPFFFSPLKYRRLQSCIFPPFVLVLVFLTYIHSLHFRQTAPPDYYLDLYYAHGAARRTIFDPSFCLSCFLFLFFFFSPRS